ncbi:MAG: hypothetical protein WCI18_12490 [Pseudomonadota bacterium]
MKSNSANGSVTINIKKSDSKDVRSISLSRWQYEALVIGVPASIVSGFVALGVLIFDFSVRPDQTHQNLASLSAELESKGALRSGGATDLLSTSQGMASADSLTKAAKHKGKASVVSSSNESPEVTKLLIAASRNSNQAVDVQNKNIKSKRPNDEGAKSEEKKITGEVIAIDNLDHSNVGSADSSQDAQTSAGSSAFDKVQGKMDNASKVSITALPVVSVTKNIKIDEIYDVSAKVYQSKSGSPIRAKISMKNLTGNKEKGRLWVKVLVSSGDEEQWLSSQINLPADESMNVTGAKIGKIYVFQTWVEHELSLGVPRIQAKEIKEIILGAETEKHGQKVAKIDMRNHSDASGGM